MLSLTSGLPTSDANPLMEELFRPAYEAEAERNRKLDAWRTASLDNLDRAVLDPDSFFAEKPINLPEPAVEALGGLPAVRQSLAVRAYLQLANDGNPIPGGDLGPELFREKLARERFNGRGLESESAFFTEIQKEAQGRKDARVFMQGVSQSAATSALLDAAGEPVQDYAAWIAEARQRPGYRRDLELDYFEEWHERNRQLRDQLQPVRDLVSRQWQAMKEGKPADMEALSGYLGDEESRETLLFAISGLVKALPKEQQPSVLANFRKQFLRRDLPTNLGGLQRSMRPFDRDQPLPDDYLDRLEPGDDMAAAEKRLRAEFEADTRRRDRFIRKLESIVNDEYDPIVPLARKGSKWEAFERGLYAAPGVAATVAVASLPGAGPQASFEILRQDSTDQARAALVQAGMDEDRADTVAADIGTVSGLIQLPMERLGLAAITQRLPFVNKAVQKLTTGIATRYLARAGATAGTEFATEMGQDLVPSIIQDIAAAAARDIPETKWTGEGGVFQDYDKQSLEVLGAILPLSLVMAGGGVLRDRRIQTIAQTDDLTLRAAGISDSAIAALRAANGIGQQEAALDAAWQSRDLNSPEAIAAQQELTARVQSDQSTAAAASDTGILPRAVRSTDGTWTLFDTNTGTEIGQAPDWQRAAALATSHANFNAEEHADDIAVIFSTYQAAEVSGQWGTDSNRPTEYNLDLGTELTAEQAAASSESARRRVAAQERLMGSDGSVTNMVFGESSTDTGAAQMKTVNRILRGGSILEVFEEETHGFRRQAHARGILTREDDLAFLRAIDTVLGQSTTREGGRLAILPADFDTLSPYDQEVAIDEGLADVMKAEIVRTRKGGGQRQLPAKIVSANLSALARLLGDQRLGKFRAFINAIREYFGLAIDRAAHIRRGLADGTLDAATYEGYLAKLLGVDEQIDYDQLARDAEAAILDGAELDTAAPGDPFSLGSRPLMRSDDPIDPNQPGGANIGDAALPDMPRDAFGNPEPRADLSVSGVRYGRPNPPWGGPYPTSARIVINTTSDWRGKINVPVMGFERADIDAAFQLAIEKAEELGFKVENDGQDHEGNPRARLIHREAAKLRSYLESLRDKQIADLKARVQREGKPTFLRYSPPPESGRSWNGKDGFYEKGVSVYPAVKLKGGTYVINLKGMDSISSMFIQSSKGGKVFEVTGAEVVGQGSDGEPLLKGGTYKKLPKSTKIQTLLDFNQSPPAASGTASQFSLGSRRLGVLTQDSIRRIKDPLRRAQAMERVSRKLEDLRLEAERLELLSGTKRLKRSLAREAAMRQALRQEELENEAWARHTAILSNDDLTKLRAQPLHALFADPTSPLRGRIMSQAAVIRQYPERYGLHNKPAEYNGSEGVSRTVFGGSLTADNAAQEAFDAGLIRDPSPDALWQALAAESRHVATMKKVLEAAKADLREARTVAKAETNAWLATQTEQQAATYSPRQEILRTLAALEAILSSVPAEIRGRVGGYVQAARIADADAGLEFLRERLAKVDAELETWLKGQYHLEFLALLDRARPEKDEAGKRPRGKIGADVHALFADLREAMTLTAAETEAEASRLEILAAQEDLTPEQQAHATLQANLVRLVGDWSKASAARREAAVLEATRVFQAGYMEERIRMSRQREDRARKRDHLAAATGKAGTREERRRRAEKDQGTRTGRVLQAGLSLMSFEQVVQKAFGEGTPDAEALVDWERRAAHAKTDAIQHKLDLLDDLFTSLAGGKLKGERLRYDMARTKGITVTDAKGREHTFSQLEAVTATLMWRQEDGRRHMLGHVDDNGNPSGEWNYTQDFVDQLEDALTPEARAVRLHLSAQYGAEYDRLNSVFRQLYGVSLPRHANYSPISVAPAQSPSGEVLDPVNGNMTAAGLTPGSLKTRSQTAVAEPKFPDALQAYIAHAKSMEHWIAYAPFATEAMAVLNARSVGNSVEAAAGRETLVTLRGWLDHFAQGGTRDASAHLAANGLFGRMMGRLSAAALVGRVSVLAIQSTQLAAALAEMPAAAYMVRLAKLFAGRLDWSAALRSDYIQRRKAQMPPVVQQALEGLSSSKPNRLKYLARKMGETISGADALFTAGTYAITYDYHLKQAQALDVADPHAYARQAAERSTDRVAQPVRPGTRSLYEVTGTNPAVRLAWSFASEARQKLMLSAYALGSKKSKGAKARALAVTWLAGGLLASVIRATMRDLRDDEDDEFFDEENWDPKRLALASLTGPLQGLPFLGDAIESAAYKMAGEYMPEGNMLSSIAQATDKGADLFDGPPKDLEEAAKTAETLLYGAAAVNETAAAAASFSHLVSDLIRIAENLGGPD